MPAAKSRRRTSVLCPDPLHEGSKVIGWGRDANAAGKVRRFRCEPLSGGKHYFSIGTAGGRRLRAQRGAPECPEHAGATITRHGTYGPGEEGRQRYLCSHEPCNSSCLTRWRRKHEHCPGYHTFVPVIPRAHVSPGDQCDECLELRGIHRGERAAARRQRLTARQVARLLSEIAAGMTYTRAGFLALDYAGVKIKAGELRRIEKEKPAKRVEERPVLADEDVPDSAWDDIEANPWAAWPPVFRPDEPLPPAKPARRRSPSRRLAARVWHVGADLVEAFGPVVWADEEAAMRKRADEIAAAGHPRVWIIDDQPIYVDVVGKRKRVGGYGVLLVAELDPLDETNPWTAKLRLVRAYPRINGVAWRLVFDEMGYTPDYIVADGGKGLSLAIREHYGDRTRFVPSLWHMLHTMRTRTFRDCLAKPAAAALGEHLDALARRSEHLASVEGWAAWWDTLITLGQRFVKLGTLTALRNDYEPRMAEALPILLGNELVPMSNSPIEALLTTWIDPILTERRMFSFGNIERTNALLDLAVCRSRGAFADLNRVARLIEDDEIPHGGHTVPLRAISDPQPASGRYQSLRDEAVMLDLAIAKRVA